MRTLSPSQPTAWEEGSKKHSSFKSNLNKAQIPELSIDLFDNVSQEQSFLSSSPPEGSPGVCQLSCLGRRRTLTGGQLKPPKPCCFGAFFEVFTNSDASSPPPKALSKPSNVSDKDAPHY
ncbi:hypothetical protein HPP92_006202 [Vanilla planifolia]|nr:hypothetical protein HPP92_006202 [Vanilla planifolia]